MKSDTVKKSKKATKATKATKETKSHPAIYGARITEKAARDAEHGTYTFNVAPTANKSEIKKAIKMMYNVSPVKVGITQITDKTVVRRGVKGVKGGGKKAVVYLKKGDKITIA